MIETSASDWYPANCVETRTVRSWRDSQPIETVVLPQPKRRPCDFRAAHAMLHLFDMGLDADHRVRRGDYSAPWTVKEAARVLQSAREAMLGGRADGGAKRTGHLYLTESWVIV